MCEAGAIRCQRKNRLSPLGSSAECARMAKPVMLVIRDGWGINPGGAAQREANGDATFSRTRRFTISSTANIR